MSDANASQASSLTGFLVPDIESADQVMATERDSALAVGAPGKNGFGSSDTSNRGLGWIFSLFRHVQ
jgi:hypothetical protein